MRHRTAHGSGGRGPTRRTQTEIDVRAEWFLREMGRFPTREELLEIREYQKWWTYPGSPKKVDKID